MSSNMYVYFFIKESLKILNITFKIFLEVFTLCRIFPKYITSLRMNLALKSCREADNTSSSESRIIYSL